MAYNDLNNISFKRTGLLSFQLFWTIITLVALYTLSVYWFLNVESQYFLILIILLFPFPLFGQLVVSIVSIIMLSVYLSRYPKRYIQKQGDKLIIQPQKGEQYSIYAREIISIDKQESQAYRPKALAGTQVGFIGFFTVIATICALMFWFMIIASVIEGSAELPFITSALILTVMSLFCIVSIVGWALTLNRSLVKTQKVVIKTYNNTIVLEHVAKKV